ncbi:MAG: hypothetical protein ACRD44_05915 [Bryobacteraceae bacterium]
MKSSSCEIAFQKIRMVKRPHAVAEGGLMEGWGKAAACLRSVSVALVAALAICLTALA